MDLNNYEVFVQVVETGSISGAALVTGYTQSAVSYIIKNLEKEFQFKLLNRTRTGVELTKYGQEMLPSIKALVAASHEVERNYFELNGLVRGHVAIACATSICSSFLLPAIKDFHDEYPHIQFKILDGSNEELDNYLVNRNADIGIFAYRRHMKHSYFFLKDDPVIVCLPPDCSEFDGKFFQFSDFAKYNYIPASYDDEFEILEDLKELHITPKCSYIMKDTFSVLSAVEKGMGFSIIPELTVKAKKEIHVKTVGLMPPRYRRICICTSNTESLSPAAQLFYDYCKVKIPEIIKES